MKSRSLFLQVCAVILLICLSTAAFAQESSVVMLPTSLQTIEAEAFMGATNLDKVVIIDGTTTIESRAFANSSLREITLPDSLSSIANDVFEGCTGLTVHASEGTYAYDWAVSNGYITPAPAPGTYTGPVITEPAWSGDMIEADIVVYRRSYQGDAADIWWWDFCREYFKIDFTVTQTTSPSDYKSIAFMGGNMPDVFYQLYMGNSAQVEWGDVNGYLLNMEPYMTPELMPNLTRIFNKLPNAKKSLQTQSGAIYSLGSFGNPNQSNMSFYINKGWLDDAGLSVPTTLNEFETALAAFKARGSDVVPMVGDLGNTPRYLANAMGWVINSASYLTQPTLRKGSDGKYHAEYMYGNEELFPVFMTYMKKWIDAGYFSSKLFSSWEAGDEASVLKAQDKAGFEQNISGVFNPSDWVSAKFLTSQWNSAPQVGRTYNAISNQSFNLDAGLAERGETAKIRRLMKWCDWHYDYDNYNLSHRGPAASDTQWLLGLKSGWTRTTDDNGRQVYTCAEMTEEGISFGDYQNRYVQGIIGGYVGLSYDMFGSSESAPSYIVDGFPQSYFLSMDDTYLQSELSWQINTYVNEQYQAFISGEKAINDANMDAFYAGLYELNFEQYENIITNYYEKNYNQ